MQTDSANYITHSQKESIRMIRVLYNIHCITRHRDPTLPLPLRYILFNQRGFFQHVLHLSDAHIRRKKKKKKILLSGKVLAICTTVRSCYACLEMWEIWVAMALLWAGVDYYVAERSKAA